MEEPLVKFRSKALNWNELKEVCLGIFIREPEDKEVIRLYRRI